MKSIDVGFGNSSVTVMAYKPISTPEIRCFRLEHYVVLNDDKVDLEDDELPWAHKKLEVEGTKDQINRFKQNIG